MDFFLSLYDNAGGRLCVVIWINRLLFSRVMDVFNMMTTSKEKWWFIATLYFLPYSVWRTEFWKGEYIWNIYMEYIYTYIYGISTWCIYWCICFSLCVRMYVQVGSEGRGQRQMSPSVALLIFRDKATHGTWSSPIWLGQLAKEVKGLSCPYFVTVGISRIGCCAWLLTWLCAKSCP